MIVEVDQQVPEYKSYAADRTRGLYNVEADDGSRFVLRAELPIEDGDWQIGAVVGPSGSGKSSILREMRNSGWTEWTGGGWPEGKPVIEALGGKDYAKATAALSAVGLGSVPSWLRPRHVLSMGEGFRADLAALLLATQGTQAAVVIDEFTSVLDRQVAQVGAGAFARAWRKKGEKRRVIVFSCHYDVLEWLQPDWWLDTQEGLNEFDADRGVVLPKAGGFQRPPISLDIRETGWRPWNAEFKRHHYLPDAGPMAFSTAYTGFVGGEAVCFVGVSGMVTGKGKREARFCRFVTKPEWQGAGLGMRFLEYLTERELRGTGFIGKPTTSIIHSAHPALAVTLRRNPAWRQISQALHGGRKDTGGTGMGGHMRAVMGFRYGGDRYRRAFTGQIVDSRGRPHE